MSKKKFKPPKYKVGQMVKFREIMQYICVIGTVHVYRVRCTKCNTVITMSEMSIAYRSERCKICVAKSRARREFNPAFRMPK